MPASKEDPEEMKVRPRRRYSDQERAEAMLVLAANGGNISATAIDTGIPYHTLRHWAAGDRHAEAIQMAKEKMPPLADRLEEVVSLKRPRHLAMKSRSPTACWAIRNAP